jgi:predicted dehydrogenase
MIHWGIIGNSDISRKRGAPAILARPEERRLLSIYSRDIARAEQFCREHGDARFGGTRPYDDLQAFLADTELQAVYVSTELYRHCAETVACAEAGKHVLCEKPMALDPAECERMIAACRANNVRLAVLFPRRYYPKVEKMRELIAEGAIGQPVTARIASSGNYAPAPGDPKYWRVVTGKGGGGNLQDMGSHYLDLLVSVLGDCAEVCGLEDHLRHNYEVPDTESALLRMRSGAHVTAHFHWSLAVGLSSFDVYGTEGALLATPVEGPRLTLQYPNRPQENWDLPIPANTYTPVFDDFDRALRTGTEPRFPGEEGAKSTAIIHAIQVSARTGRRVAL